ncbi:VOC family protein [Novosphingobium profundi]|uniref:VOC family protein n=1 Tax=Novosphingobium profundi TaxID=1774954 RepID=UPI001BD96EBE|nr:VOC family protein [Novosphingobium profundi]MBT0670940.1 VOC family protein [Novosphingobium profundi]
MATENQAGAFIWYELICADPARAKAFYDAVVGWNIAPEGAAMASGATYHMIARADGGNAGAVLGMSPEMREHGAKPVWMGYVGVPDVDAALARFVAAGGAVHLPAFDLPVGRIAMVADPWGALLYLMTPIPPEGKPEARSDVWSPDAPQHVRWNELWSTDQAAARAFYTETFGWGQNGAMPMGPAGDYLFLQHGDDTIGALGQARPEGEGSRWEYFLGVADIESACAAVEAGGGTLLGTPQMLPGGEYCVYSRDPEGASFGLVGPRAGEPA